VNKQHFHAIGNYYFYQRSVYKFLLLASLSFGGVNALAWYMCCRVIHKLLSHLVVKLRSQGCLRQQQLQWRFHGWKIMPGHHHTSPQCHKGMMRHWLLNAGQLGCFVH